jgi:hypothetical protein
MAVNMNASYAGQESETYLAVQTNGNNQKKEEQ